jgi:16S rRNA (guanine527-N7)-methyltransferase
LTEALEDAIAREAAARGLGLEAAAVTALADHARLVLRENPRLHLTAIASDEIVSRHIGESFDGAARLDPGVTGLLLDLGSGNGYPGIPIVIARPRMRLLLVEASRKKADFLRRAIEVCGLPGDSVLERQVQRASDLEDLDRIEVLTLRAVGGWERILPRLASRLTESGRILLWAGTEVDRVRSRVAWRKLDVQARFALPGRVASWIWTIRPV